MVNIATSTKQGG